MEYILLFLLGILVGSFLNVLIDRLPRGESVVKGRSYCESCKTVLRWYDLIPLLSFLQIKGKCRYCKTSLSYYYPIIELITGVVFVSIYWWFIQYQISNIKYQRLDLLNIGNIGIYLTLVFILYIVSSLIVIFFTDLKYGIIPNKILYPMIIISFLTLFTSEEPPIAFATGQAWLPLRFALPPSEVLISYLLSAMGAFLFFFLIFLITRGKGMGFGDVKLAFFVGLFLGFPKVISAFYIAFLTGAIVSIILVLAGRKRFKGGSIPFGPFLILGMIMSFFWGEKLLHVFLNGIF